MAKKGQRFQRYTEEEKNEILNKYNNGQSSYSIEREYGISNNTIRMWQYKANHPELNQGRKRGRPTEISNNDYKERFEILKKYQAFLKARRGKK